MSKNTTSASQDDKIVAAVATIPPVGAIMYFVMKNPSDLVKFYSKQNIGFTVLSTIVLIFNWVFGFIVNTILWNAFYTLGFLASCLNVIPAIMGFAIFVLWLILFINALQEKKWRVPLISDLVDKVIK